MTEPITEKKLKPSAQILPWKDLRDEVLGVNSELVDIIDRLNSTKEINLCKVDYPFGAAIFDSGTLFLPNDNNNFVPIKDNTISDEMKKYFGCEQTPFGMVLKRSISNSVEGKYQFIPLTAFYPGQFFGLREVFDGERSLFSSAQWNLYSGARALFSTTKISNQKKYQSIKRKFGLRSNAPETAKDHFFLFKELVNHSCFSCDWSTTVLFFSKDIKEQIISKGKWLELQGFFLDYCWKQSMVWRFDAMMRVVWSQIANLLKEKGVKNFGFQLGVLKHIVAISLGSLPCFISSDQEELAAPLKLIKKLLIDEYNIEFCPTIMVPAHLSKDRYCSGYYSVNDSIPIEETYINKRVETSVETTRGIQEIYELTKDSVVKNKTDAVSPLFQRLMKDVKLSFFHPVFDEKRKLLSSSLLPRQDSSLIQLPKEYGKNTIPFNENSSFFRGLISIDVSDFYF